MTRTSRYLIFGGGSLILLGAMALLPAARHEIAAAGLALGLCWAIVAGVEYLIELD